MPLPLAPIVVVTVAMTLRSDTKPVKIYLKKPRGTLYWGGAGLNGPYINDQIQTLLKIGIQHVYRGVNTTGNEKTDALWTATTLRYQDTDEWTITSGLDNPSGQFNLIGYSYGSLLAAQTANFYANQGHIVDHLVLIGCPIDSGFLNSLIMNKNIKNVIRINLTSADDPLYAGMSEAALIASAKTLMDQDTASGTTKGIGHFYFRPDSKEGRDRRTALAKYLYDQGLR
ncbi:thioesterase domain-containing protein [Collimonas fungivorans]|uniref:thioesterase domain-containing protein n=1 Tax=Collimonas fungivorans TaxID=158899 RepID=UPI0005A1BD43|nr:thioesterase domain-containing protein [Collimonas fungivorans]